MPLRVGFLVSHFNSHTMIIQKIQRTAKVSRKDFLNQFAPGKHFETTLVTTWYLLFIPIFRSVTVTGTQL